jgi:hypothetical protein
MATSKQTGRVYYLNSEMGLISDDIPDGVKAAAAAHHCDAAAKKTAPEPASALSASSSICCWDQLVACRAKLLSLGLSCRLCWTIAIGRGMLDLLCLILLLHAAVTTATAGSTHFEHGCSTVIIHVLLTCVVGSLAAAAFVQRHGLTAGTTEEDVTVIDIAETDHADAPAAVQADTAAANADLTLETQTKKAEEIPAGSTSNWRPREDLREEPSSRKQSQRNADKPAAAPLSSSSSSVNHTSDGHTSTDRSHCQSTKKAEEIPAGSPSNWRLRDELRRRREEKSKKADPALDEQAAALKLAGADDELAQKYKQIAHSGDGKLHEVDHKPQAKVGDAPAKQEQQLKEIADEPSPYYCKRCQVNFSGTMCPAAQDEAADAEAEARAAKKKQQQLLQQQRRQQKEKEKEKRLQEKKQKKQQQQKQRQSKAAAPPGKPPPRKAAAAAAAPVEAWRDPSSAEYDPARVKANEAFAKAQEVAGNSDELERKKQQKQKKAREALEAKMANEQVSHDEQLLAEARAVFADPNSSKAAVAAAVAQMNAAAKKK